jgi:hypothetical protein
MASQHTLGYQPIALPDWKELLQSLAAYIETLEADNPQKASPGIDAKSRAGLIKHYIADLEHCLDNANGAIRYYDSLVKNYDRLVAVMEESRNQAYDIIGRLKHEIGIAKEYPPIAYTEESPSEGRIQK